MSQYEVNTVQEDLQIDDLLESVAAEVLLNSQAVQKSIASYMIQQESGFMF